MARRERKFTIVSGLTALTFLASGVLLDVPAHGATAKIAPGPVLTSLGTEQVLTFPVSGSSAAPSLGALSAASYSASAISSINKYSRELRLTGSLRTLRTLTGSAGERRVHVQQLISGIPVMGGEAVVDLTPSGQTRSITSEFLPDSSPASLVPTLSASQAANRLTSSKVKYAKRPSKPQVLSSSLEIYDPRIFGAPGAARATLVWRLVVRDSTHAQSSRTVLIDAHRGSVVLDISNEQKLASISVCDNQSMPVDPATLGCDTIPGSGSYYVAARANSATPSGNQEVDSAYDNAQRTLTFYNDYLGRNSVDGSGLRLTSIVNVCVAATTNSSEQCPYSNAFWDGQQMIYGAGLATADDVVAHEISHGLTQYGPNLFYFYQSGAINESLSDIFGEFVDQTDGYDVVGGPTSNLWQLGEDSPDGVIRSLQNPTQYGQPDTTSSPMYGNHNPWDVDASKNSLFDNGDVHTNSGIGNHFAYLLTDTSLSNPLGSGSGIGIGKAAPIIYGAEQLLTSGSDYRSFAAALRLSCSSLIGTVTPHGETIVISDCGQVDLAIKHVRMDSTPTGTRASAAICPAGLTPKTLWRDTMENPASGRWSKSAAGANVTPALWYYGSQAIPYYGGLSIGSYATSGKDELWGDDPEPVAATTFGAGKNHADHRISMTKSVSIPAGVATYMRFNHSFGFETDADTSPFLRPDGGVVEYSVDGGKIWTDAYKLMTGTGNNGYNGSIDYWVSNTTRSFNPIVSAAVPRHVAFVGQSKGYQSSRAVLTSLAGKSVRIRFRATADQWVGDFGWAIDDVSFYSCVPYLNFTAVPPVSTTPQTLRWGNDLASVGAGATAEYRVSTAGSGTAVPPYGAYIPVAGSSFGQIAFPTQIAGGTACIQVRLSLPSLPSPVVGSRCTTTPVDDRALVRKGSWSSASSSTAFRGTLSRSVVRGASLQLNKANGKHVVIQAISGPGMGKISVYAHGSLVATIDLASRTAARVVQWDIPVTLLSGTPVRIVVSTTGKLVSIDGLAIRP